MSAVSKKVMPASRQALITAVVASASIRPPKLLQPRPTSETLRPEWPRFRYSTKVPLLADETGRKCSGDAGYYTVPSSGTSLRSDEHRGATDHTHRVRWLMA